MTRPNKFVFVHVDQLMTNVLSADGETGANTDRGGRMLELQNYLHLGEGTLPTFYLVDTNGVTLIVTHGITAEVLRTNS